MYKPSLPVTKLCYLPPRRFESRHSLSMTTTEHIEQSTSPLPLQIQHTLSSTFSSPSPSSSLSLCNIYSSITDSIKCSSGMITSQEKEITRSPEVINRYDSLFFLII